MEFQNVSLPFKPIYREEYYFKSSKVLETALNEIAAYQSWRKHDLGRTYSVDARYAAMPALTKKDIREFSPRGFQPLEQDFDCALSRKEIGLVETSGTVDERVTNVWNQEWWDASERASWKLNSHAAQLATGDHREAILANPLNVGLISDNTDLPIEKRRLSRFLFLNEKTNPLSWTPNLIDRMIAELEVFKPAILEANPSLLAKLARYASANKKQLFQPGLIVFTYEYPTNFHYRQIQQVFNGPMASSYGTTETGYVFMQCEEGKFHQNSEYCRVDFQPFKPEHGGTSVGRILVTTFNNPWYYMVRFEVGDLVRVDETGRCPCGRNEGLILSDLEGRSRDVTLTCKGRAVTLRELDNTLGIWEGIDEYKLEQIAWDSYLLHIVSRRKDKHAVSGEAEEVLSKLYGKEAKLSIFFEEAISPAASGKYRLASTSFSVETKKFLDERYLPKNNMDS